MFQWKQRKEKNFFAGLFPAMVVTMVVTILTLSGILNFSFENIAQRQIFSYTLSSLEQTSRNTARMTETAGTFARQIYKDIHVSRLVNFATSDVMDTTLALTALNNYRATSPVIESIYVYDATRGIFYISSDSNSDAVQKQDDFYDREIVSMVRNYKTYPVLRPIPRKVRVISQNLVSDTHDNYTYFFYDTLANGQVNSIVILNLKGTWIEDGTGSSEKRDDAVLMVDRGGRLVSGAWKYPMLTDISSLPEIRQVLDSPDASGYFTGHSDGTRVLVSFTEPDDLGWRYVQISNYHKVVGKINSLRTATVAIGLGILLLGLMSSYIISRRLSTRVDQSFDRLRALESEQRNSFQTLRQDMLRGLLRDHSPFQPDRMSKSFRHFRVPLQPEAPVQMLLLKTDRYREFTRMHPAEDRQVLRFGMINIAEEILSEGFVACGIDTGEDALVILIQHRDGAVTGDTDSLIQRIQASVLEYLNLSVTAVISDEAEDMSELIRLYRQVSDGAWYRFYRGHGALLEAAPLAGLRASVYVYPENRERQLTEALMAGHTGEVSRLFREILEETSVYSKTSYQLAAARLAFALQGTIGRQLKNLGLPPEMDINTLTDTMAEAELLDEACLGLDPVLEALSQLTETHRGSRHEDLADRVMAYIGEHFMDPSLSLEMIADAMEMSATHLGRLFKRYTQKTLLSAIVEVRMEKARDLLLSDRMPVADVAEQTGFSDTTYFHRTFKKIHGVTPAEFRRRSLPEDEIP